MKTKTIAWQLGLFILLTGVVAVAPALAGSAVIGSVAGSTNATIGGQSLLPNTTIFSGDSVQVRDGVAVIAVGTSNRVIFGHDTVASFLRDSKEVTVLLSRGNVSMLHPNEGSALRVKAGEISITPAAGFKTLGEIAMLNGSVVVTAKEGALQVEDHGVTKDVAKGQTIVISPKTSQNKGGGAGWGNTGSTTLEIVTLGLAGTGAILAGVAMSRAGNATNSANEAIAAADAAESAAVAASNGANSTASQAASSAAAAAASAAEAQLLAECLIDATEGGYGNYTSPFVLSALQCGHLP